MDIAMIGIDHERAPIEIREALSFTKAQRIQTMRLWQDTGCLLLSTCNRTEFWVSGNQEKNVLYDFLCRAKGLNQTSSLEGLMSYRQGKDAIAHLLQLACGVKSRIYGEDQILAQVKDALLLSRQCQCADRTIEKLFQTAIAAAKKVKTSVETGTVNPSAAQSCLEMITGTFGAVKDLSCLVIGSGNMGKLVASLLAEKGANVCITQRRRRHKGTLQTPISVNGCTVIEYEKRLENIQDYHVVISATASPHYTVKEADLTDKLFKKSLWIDLAVPRDMAPSIGDISGIHLVDMDQVGSSSSRKDQNAYRETLRILGTYELDLEQWFEFREHIETVKRISSLVTEDAGKRSVDDSDLPDATRRAVEKMLFGLKETLPREQWKACFAALEQSAEKETLKR